MRLRSASRTASVGAGLPPTVARNSLFGVAGQLAIRVLSVLFGVAVVRRFGAAAFGEYTAALAFVGLFSVLSDLGLGAWGVRAVAQDRARTGSLVVRIASLRLLLSAFAAAVIVGAAAWLYPPAQLVAIALAACQLFLFGLSGALDMAWLGHERLDITSAVAVINQLAFVALGTAALVWGGGAVALILAALVAQVVAVAVSWRLARRHLALRLSPPVVRGGWSLVRACAPLGAVQISLLVSYKADTVLLSLFRDSSTVGVYAVAYNVVFSLMLLSHSINLAIYPALSRAGSDRAAGRSAATALRYLLAASVPFAVGGAILAPALISTLYTDRFAASAAVLRVVIWVVPLMFLTEFLGYYATALGRERQAGRAAVVMAVANVALNLVCIPLFGVWAATVITVLTEGVFLAQYLWMLRDVAVSREIARLLWRPALAAAVMAGVLLAIPAVPLAAAIALGGATYLGVLVGLGGATRSDLAAVLHRRPALLPVADATGGND